MNDQGGILICRYLVIAACMFLSGCDMKYRGFGEDFEDRDPSKKPKQKPVPVEVASVRRGPIESTLERSAPLEAEARVRVVARTANPAIELLVEEGDEVKKDQVLLRLENDTQRTQLEKAKVQLEKAQQEFERQEKLHQENLISEQVYRNAKFEFRQLELAADDAARQLAYTEVRAPIKGIISTRLVKLGDQVTAGLHLFDIVDFDSTVAVIHVPEQYLRQLRVNQPARLTSRTLGDQKFEGYVQRISPIVEAQNGTVKVTVGIRDLSVLRPGEGLRPGMFVDVELVLATRENALLIPKKALIYDGDQLFAFKMTTHLHTTNGIVITNRVVKRFLVEPELMDRDHVEPRGAFQEGDQVIIAGQSGLKDKAKVRLPDDPEPEETGDGEEVAKGAQDGEEADELPSDT